MKIEVTSASKHSQKLSEVPSAIFVATQDDIRRSGVTSIPEALRMAHGVEVARIGTNKWAISIRGFNGHLADKLQVFMDDRSAYNPLFAEMQWEQQDTLMEDIEWIEVIRGPNAAVWRANYRLYHNKVLNTELISFNPRLQANYLASANIRDEITLIPEYLRLILGLRFDHNDFTGMEIQPNARLMLTPNEKNSAVSRARRTPSRAKTDIHLNSRTLTDVPKLSTLRSFPILTQLAGTFNFNSEKLLAYKLGFRHQFSFEASLDVATFYNDYSQLRDLSAGALSFHAGFPPHLILPVLLTNKVSGYTYGVETSVNWRASEKWRLQGNYSFIDMYIHSGSILRQFDSTTGSANTANPQHQISARSHYDFSDHLQLNLWLRYVSSIDFYRIPGYVTMDTRLAYEPKRNIELFIIGQNLSSRNHRELISDFIPSFPTYIPRDVYAGAE